VTSGHRQLDAAGICGVFMSSLPNSADPPWLKRSQYWHYSLGRVSGSWERSHQSIG
jgi:hypothetical protein